MRQTRVAVALALAASGILALSGCATNQDDGLSSQYRDGGTENYVSGDGTERNLVGRPHDIGPAHRWNRWQARTAPVDIHPR